MVVRCWLSVADFEDENREQKNISRASAICPDAARRPIPIYFSRRLKGVPSLDSVVKEQFFPRAGTFAFSDVIQPPLN